MRPVTVRTLQAALAYYASQNPRIPSPGPVDGIWRSSIVRSLEAFFVQARTPETDRRHTVQVDPATGARLVYLPSSVQVAIRSGEQLYNAAQRPPADVIPPAGGGDMATREIQVSTIQKGLKVWKASSPADARPLDPGAVDGLWGPRTHDALRAFVAYVAPRRGLDSARVLAPLRNTVQSRDRSIYLDETMAQALTELSRSYEPMVRRTTGESPTHPDSGLPAVRQSSMMPVILGTVVGAAIFGGIAYYFLKD